MLKARIKHHFLYFKPEYYSLVKPHPILTSCGSNPFETNKSVVQCRLLSGRYRSDWLARHWSKVNKDGHCSLCLAARGDITHMLSSCTRLSDKRTDIFTFSKVTQDNQYLSLLMQTKLSASDHELTQFLVDPTVDPDIIYSVQMSHFSIEQILKVTRTICYGLHRKRLQLSGRWNNI